MPEYDERAKVLRKTSWHPRLYRLMEPRRYRPRPGPPRRGGRVVEGARLERVYTGNRIKGSNPFLSAIAYSKQK